MTQLKPTLVTILGCALLVAAGPDGAHGQVDPGATFDVRRPAPEAPSVRDPDVFELPSLSAQRAGAGGLAGPRFTLTEIDVRGANLIDAARIDAVTSRYTGRPITHADLVQLRDDLTKLYVSEGYISSGAVLPDQEVSDGVLEIEIVEGRLDSVSVSGNSFLTNTYFQRRLGADGRVLSAVNLQRDFQLLLEDSNVRRLDARLVPGEQLGSAALEIEVEEERRWDATAFVASDRSPSVGGVRGGVAGLYRSLIWAGDQISAEVGVTEGLVDGRAEYSFPLGATRWSGAVFASAADAEIQDEPLASLGAESRSRSLGASTQYPLIAEPGRALNILAAFETTHVETELFGIPFDFAPGSMNGETRYSTVRLSPSYVVFSNRRALSLGASLAVGVEGESAPVGAPAIPEPDFWHLSANVFYVRRFSNHGRQLILQAAGRYTDESLYSTEKFVAGGTGSVRGYRKNTLLSDRGVFVSVEYQLPLSEVTGVAGAWSSDVTLAAFVDAAQVDNVHQSDPIEDTLSSAGVRVLWEVADRVLVDAHWAHAFEDLPFDDDFQDDGFGFRVMARF